MDTLTEYKDWLPSFADLPMEIILYVLRYVDIPDLQAACTTCTRWRYAVFDQEFNNDITVCFSKTTLSDRHPPACDFLKCERPFRHYRFEEVTFGQSEKLLAHIGKSATHITFDNVDLSDKQFYSIIQKFSNLKSLTIKRCSSLFITGSFLDNNDDGMMICPALSTVKCLSLRCNQYLSDAILLRITMLIQGIETFDMSGNHIAFHHAIQRRFYPNEELSSPSESILTFKFLMSILIMHRQYLRELNFSHTMISGSALTDLSEPPNEGLQLLRLRLANCRQLNTVSVKSFLKTQSQLVVLDLSNTICVNDDCLQSIATMTPQLEELIIAGCAAVTDEGAAFLSKLKCLRRLNISNCDGISSDGVVRGIATHPNSMLRELRMASLKVDEGCIKMISYHLSELRVLDVGHCINAITDEAVQCIIQNLRWLRELSLEDCFRITDSALTGINISNFELESLNSSSLESFHPLPTSSMAERANSVQPLKISLRSRAEEDIVRDAIRKKAMMAAHKMNYIEDGVPDGYNIQQLRGLKLLNLKGCNKITDVSLKYGFRFNELQLLSLSNCQQISLIGMAELVSNCPSIEELDLSDCYNIDDKTVQVVTAKLGRLRTLHISGCPQLTDHSLDAILVNCKSLQTLSVYRCRRMYTDIEERLTSLPTLRNVNMDNSSSMDNVDVFRLKKRLDY